MTQTDKRDILLLGATGFTGKLILQYLVACDLTDKSTSQPFSLALGGRSIERLAKVADEVGIKDHHHVDFYHVNMSDEASLKDVVKNFRVVISTIGPFWHYGQVLLGVCAQLGVHYVDTTGETWFIRRSIEQWDYLAVQTGAILIPSAGFDSVPSDMSAFLGVQNLRRAFGWTASAGSSTSAFKLQGGGISGGTAQTIVDAMSGGVPRDQMARVRYDGFALSPVPGVPVARPRVVYTQPFTNIIGGFFFMSPANTQIVRRTWGLYQAQAMEAFKPSEPTLKEESPYGEGFSYQEFMVFPGRIASAIVSLGIAFFAGLMLFPPFRWIAKLILPKAGDGPDMENVEDGYFKVTNVTTLDSTNGQAEGAVKTVIRGRGEPGYFLTSIMTSETAVALLPNNRKHLTHVGRQGGIQTTMSALGTELIKRLERTGRFSFESDVLTGTFEKPESRKTQ